MADLPFVDPNAAVPDRPADPQPAEDPVEKAIVKRVKTYMGYAMAATGALRKSWSSNHDFVVLGQQWSLKRPRYRFSEVINLTWANIMTEVGLETDQSPKFDYIPQDPSDYQFCKILQSVNDANWSKPANQGFGWLDKTTQASFQRKIFDVVHAEIGWDPKLELGTGDVCYNVLNPFGCYWDPQAKDISQCRWFIYAEPIPTTELNNKFKDQNLKQDFNALNTVANTGQVDPYNIDRGFSSTGPTSSLTQNPIAKTQASGEPLTLLLRVWLKDEETVDIELENPDDPTKKIYETRKRFPKGRYLEIANDKVLWDEGEGGMPHPDYPHIFEDGLFPIAQLKNYDYGEYVGQNEVDHQKGVQKTLNYTVSHILDQFKSISNPINVISDKAADRKSKITNEPGSTWVLPSMNDYKREPGLPIAGGAFNLVETLTNFQGKVSGISDAAGYGIPDPNIGSGKQLDLFQTIAQTRTRLKSRSLASYLTQVGLLCTSRYLQFYTDKRVFRITNEEGYPEHVEFYIDQGHKDAEGNPLAKITRHKMQQGLMVSETPEQFPVKGLPDVRIDVNSALPFSKQIEQDKATQAFQAGAITSEDYLKGIGWPNYQEATMKVKQQQQEMAAQQQGQQGAK